MKRLLSYLLIVLIVVSCVLSAFLIWQRIKCIIRLNEMIDHYKTLNLSQNDFSEVVEHYRESRNVYVLDLIFLSFIEVVNLVSAGLILYGILKNPARLTYEEYKEQAETRRFARLEKKRAALEEKQKSIQDELDRMK